MISGTLWYQRVNIYCSKLTITQVTKDLSKACHLNLCSKYTFCRVYQFYFKQCYCEFISNTIFHFNIFLISIRIVNVIRTLLSEWCFTKQYIFVCCGCRAQGYNLLSVHFRASYLETHVYPPPTRLQSGTHLCMYKGLTYKKFKLFYDNVNYKNMI